ncbi:MAG: transcription termination factor Rho [Dehalococcoidia bacterium]|nr:transcription termination factor Rho [Dehalococcoidia bacterium]
MAELEDKTKEELLELAQQMGLGNGTSLTNISRVELVDKLLNTNAEQQGVLLERGILDIMGDGYGFLRQNGMMKPGQRDVYVSQSQIRRFSLRTGDLVTGQVRSPKESERYYGLIRVEAVNGQEPEVSRNRPHFEDLVPIFPYEHIQLETLPVNLSSRLIDMLAPIGRGQRGLIVSPPKAGKTMLLKEIANGITSNYDDIHLIVALIGERPEEVTDVRRSVNGEVFSSTFDDPVEDHCRVAELALERAKRIVETGKDVTILLDSITRLTRAYNLAVPTSGRTLSGGIDPVALYPPKRFFGAARKAEDNGSLTIIATCLIDTGSRMDDVIYEEFKGTGNWEVHLDRKLADRRIFPAIDIQRSGTRREELILSESALKQVFLLRRMVNMISSDGAMSTDATEKVLERLTKTRNNEEFLTTLNREAS